MLTQAQFGLVLDSPDIVDPISYFVVSLLLDVFVEAGILVPVQSVFRTYDSLGPLCHDSLTVLSIFDSPLHLLFHLLPLISYSFLLSFLFRFLLSLALVQFFVQFLFILGL